MRDFTLEEKTNRTKIEGKQNNLGLINGLHTALFKCMGYFIYGYAFYLKPYGI